MRRVRVGVLEVLVGEVSGKGSSLAGVRTSEARGAAAMVVVEDGRFAELEAMSTSVSP